MNEVVNEPFLGNHSSNIVDNFGSLHETWNHLKNTALPRQEPKRNY